MSISASGFRKHYQKISGNLIVATTTDDTTIVAAVTNHTIYLQKVYVSITGASAGKTWTLDDNAGTPRQLAGPWPTDTDGSHFEADYGSEGVPCTQGQALLFNVSATGAAGVVTWEGYIKRTGVAAA